MLSIRAFKTEDAKSLSFLLNNRNIWNKLRDYLPHPYTEKDAVEFIEFCHSQKPSTHFAIDHNGELIGSIGLTLQDDVHRKSAEIGYWIGEAFWGQGFATKAVELVLDYGFKHLDIVRIFTGVFENNKASQKVLLKNGFVIEGVHKKAIYKNETFYDEICFAKIKA